MMPRTASPRSSYRGALLVASLMLLLALAPATASTVSAHPIAAASHTIPAAPSYSPPVLTLHFHSQINDNNAPARMGTDTAGNLYVSDIGSNQVSMYDVNDNFVRAFGTGTRGSGNGDLYFPAGIAVSANTVFVVNSRNNRVERFSQATGSYLGQFGNGILNAPEGMALGTNGQLYVVDTGNNRVARFDENGNYLGAFGSLGSGSGQFNDPLGIAASALGVLYVADYTNSRIEEFGLNGSFIRAWTTGNPVAVAVDRTNMIYSVALDSNSITEYDAIGHYMGVYFAPSPGPETNYGFFNRPEDVAIVEQPNMAPAIYVSDTDTFAVQRFDRSIEPISHNYQGQWGTSGINLGQFASPYGLAFDSFANLYVVDNGNNRVEKFDQYGNFQLQWGTSGTGNGQFSHPTGITVDANNNIYVSDTGNNRIEVFDTAGNYLRQWGSAGSGNGQFNTPEGLTTDNTHIYVADSQNHRIQIFKPDGTYVAQWNGSDYGGSLTNPTGVAIDINRQELYVADAGANQITLFDNLGRRIADFTYYGTPLNQPVGIFTDQQGNLYVTDTGNNRIAQFTVNDQSVTAFGTAGNGSGQFNRPSAGAVDPFSGQLYVVDQQNNRIQRFGSPYPTHDTIGIYRPSTRTFYLRNENSTGPADITVPMPYAQTGDLPVVGDWSGDGVDTVGLYRPSIGTFLLQDTNTIENAPDYTFALGMNGDLPIVGDWNGIGRDGVGVFRPSNGVLYLKNLLSTGYADDSMILGVSGDVGVAGDWNADGQDSPGVYRPSNQTFYLTDKVTNGVVFSDYSATLGISGDVPFTGDWGAQGSSGIGVFRPSNGITYEKNAISTGPADNHFIYGVAGDIPVAGQWVFTTAPGPIPPHGASTAAPRPSNSGHSGGTTGIPTKAPAATPRRSIAR